jgi:hypothetical protein
VGNNALDGLIKRFLHSDLYRFFGRALQSKRRRRILYLFIIATAISVVLDSLGSALWQFFALVGAAGSSMYMGVLLLLVLPPGWGDYPLYRLLALVMIAIGIGVVVAFLAVTCLKNEVHPRVWLQVLSFAGKTG